jgi:magnesium transporter
MIGIYSLTNSRIHSLTPKEAKKERKKLVWFRCTELTEDEILLLCAITNIETEEIYEFLTEDERPRLDIEKTLQIIYRAPYKTKTVPISIFIDKNYVITVEKKRIAPLEDIEDCAKRSKLRFLFKRNPGGFIHYILDRVNDDFFNHINTISQNFKMLQQPSAVDTMKKKAEEIYSTSVTLSYFHQSLIADLEAMNALRKSYFRQFTKQNREGFSELYFDVLQLIDTARIERETVSSLFNLQSIISSNRLNLFIKKLTSIALIVMIPTLISGIFGMNVKVPLGNNEYGFYYIILFMIGICALLLLIFKLLDWL